MNRAVKTIQIARKYCKPATINTAMAPTINPVAFSTFMALQKLAMNAATAFVDRSDRVTTDSGMLDWKAAVSP